VDESSTETESKGPFTRALCY